MANISDGIFSQETNKTAYKEKLIENDSGSLVNGAVNDALKSVAHSTEGNKIVEVNKSDSSSNKESYLDRLSKTGLSANEALAVHQLLAIGESEVPPVYKDFSKMPDEEIAKTVKSKSGISRETFVTKLHSILERSEIDGYSSIISWAPHGRAFRIHDQELFLKQIIPRFFYQSKMASFVRQLGSYGFHKIVREENKDRNSYYNELFLRGRPELCQGITRLNKCSLIVPPSSEPDFSR